MSGSKPQRRFVSKGRYVRTLGKIVSMISLTVITALACVFFGMMTIYCLGITATCGDSDSNIGIWREAGLPCSMICGGLTYATFRCYGYFSNKTDSIEPEELLTDRNAHLLPLQDTLVRASDLPPTEPQDELLRAVQTGQETPPEQLLRIVAADE